MRPGNWPWSSRLARAADRACGGTRRAGAGGAAAAGRRRRAGASTSRFHLAWMGRRVASGRWRPRACHDVDGEHVARELEREAHGLVGQAGSSALAATITTGGSRGRRGRSGRPSRTPPRPARVVAAGIAGGGGAPPPGWRERDPRALEELARWNHGERDRGRAGAQEVDPRCARVGATGGCSAR